MAMAKTGRRAALTAAMLGLACLLAGCTGKPLAEREIVRAVFFAREDGGYHTVLLLQDQSSEDVSAYRTADGAGSNAAQALADAVQSLDGTVFYGAMDCVGLPAGSDWQEVRALSGLISENAQPSPEISLFLLDTRSAGRLAETAGELYDDLQSCEDRYGIHCGIENVAAQPDVLALPAWQAEGYGFSVLVRDHPPIRYTQPLRAQLAAILCGQADRFDLILDDPAISCTAAAAVRVQASEQELGVRLQLSDVRLSGLAGAGQPPDDETLQSQVCRALEQAFDQQQRDLQETGADPFRLQFWAQCRLGTNAPRLPARLQVQFS